MMASRILSDSPSETSISEPQEKVLIYKEVRIQPLPERSFSQLIPYVKVRVL